MMLSIGEAAKYLGVSAHGDRSTGKGWRESQPPSSGAGPSAEYVRADRLDEVAEYLKAMHRYNEGAGAARSAQISALAKAALIRLDIFHTAAAKERIGQDEARLPRLNERIMQEACKAHFGDDNIDGVYLTHHEIDYTFREAFKRMWSGVRKAVSEASVHKR